MCYTYNKLIQLFSAEATGNKNYFRALLRINIARYVIGLCKQQDGGKYEQHNINCRKLGNIFC